MAAKTEKKANNTLPLSTDDPTPSSNITYNSEVVAIIAGLAANEVEGIAGMCGVSGSLMNKNRNVTKGVKVEVGTEEVAVDLYVIVEYGIPIQRAAADAQENVRKAIESMTGLHVVRVDVHVQSVSFEQDKKALQAGAQQAALAAGESEPELNKLTDAPAGTPEPAAEVKESSKKPAGKSAQADKKESTAQPAKDKAKNEPKIKVKTEKQPGQASEGKDDKNTEAKA